MRGKAPSGPKPPPAASSDAIVASEVATFARAFPALASRLAAGTDDPSVEQLVGGLDVLAARVERALEATAPRAANYFADLLFPELLRPFPSATVLEIIPIGTAAGTRRFVEAGAEFDSISIFSARARFRAHAHFRIDPWRVEDARVAWSTERGQSLDVTLAAVTAAGGAGAGAPPVFPLRLHFAGEPRAALTLLSWLDQRLESLEVDAGGAGVRLTKDAVRLWGFRADEALLPIEPLEHPGVRLVREWLVLPAKFAFVELAGPQDLAAPRVTLRFRFDGSLPQGLNVSRDVIRTNCVPVVNAFAATTEPPRPSLAQPSHVLRPAGFAPEHADVYALRQVTGTLYAGGTLRVPEGASFRRAEGSTPLGLTYTVRTEGGPGGVPVHCLELEMAPDAGEAPEIQSLSVDAWATNRTLAGGLGIGDISMRTPGSPPACTFRNIRAITPYRPAHQGAALRRATLALLARSTGSMATVEAMHTLLHALNLHVYADSQAARAHAQRVAALQGIDVRPSALPLARTVARGHDVDVALSERAFDGEGEAFVFGKVLAHLFGHEASLNAFARTSVRLVDTGRAYRFAALNGDRVVR